MTDTEAPCRFCGGSGSCGKCAGQGTLVVRHGRLRRKRTVTCTACEGTGVCPLCKGTGRGGHDPLSREVLAYLRREFPDGSAHEVVEPETPNAPIRTYRLDGPRGSHLLLLDDQVLSRMGGGTQEQLARWRVADALRDADELPVFVGRDGPRIVGASDEE